MAFPVPPLRRLARIAATGLLVLAIALAAAEAGLRLFGFGPAGLHTVDAAEFARIPGMYSPAGRQVIRQVPALPYAVSVNALGYRGTGFPLRKPADELRVVVVGDSFTFGDFVDDGETLPARLGEALSAACRGVRVVNAGLSGSSIVSHRHVANRSLAIEPDLVLVVFYENDVQGMEGTPYWDRLADARERKSRFPWSVAYAAARHTALWTAILRARARIAAPAPRAPEDARPAVHRDELRAAYEREFAALVAEMSSGGVAMAATAYPSHLTARGLQSTDQIDWFREVAGRAGVHYADMLPAFAGGEAAAELYLLPHDGHPSPAGHARGARAVAAALQSHPLLAGRCP